MVIFEDKKWVIQTGNIVFFFVLDPSLSFGMVSVCDLLQPAMVKLLSVLLIPHTARFLKLYEPLHLLSNLMR